MPEGANKKSEQSELCSDVVRAWGLEPQRIAAREPKGDVTSVKVFVIRYGHGQTAPTAIRDRFPTIPEAVPVRPFS